MTPNEARKPANQLQVKINLELKRRHDRKYPEIKVGDKVKLYKKKKTFHKQHISVWTDTAYRVTSITQSDGQNLYHVAGHDKALLRSEILLSKV